MLIFSLLLLLPSLARTSIECLLLNSYGSMLFCGGSDGTLIIRRAWDLQEVDRSIQFPDHGAITAMILQGGLIPFPNYPDSLILSSLPSPLSCDCLLDEYYLIVGTEDGMIHVCTDPETKWKPMTGGLLKNTLFS